MSIFVKVVKHDIRDYYYLLNGKGKWERMSRESYYLHIKGVYKSSVSSVVNGKCQTIYEY